MLWALFTTPALAAVNKIALERVAGEVEKVKTILAEYLEDGRYLFTATTTMTVFLEARNPGDTEWAPYWRPVNMLSGDSLEMTCKDGITARLVKVCDSVGAVPCSGR